MVIEVLSSKPAMPVLCLFCLGAGCVAGPPCFQVNV